MNLRMLSDADLIASLKKEVLEELKKMMSVLEHLREVDRRKLYAEHECDSLWAFCIKESYQMKYPISAVREYHHESEIPPEQSLQALTEKARAFSFEAPKSFLPMCFP
jgi:hypothetical protein